jgi:hypothetical protein
LSKGEFQLLPKKAFDFRSSVIAGALGDYHRPRLFAGSAAGKAEFVLGLQLLHIIKRG